MTPTSGLTTTEAGGTARFTVALTSQPTDEVTIDLSSLDPTEGLVASTRLVFTSANWNSPQELVVTGVDDSDVDGDVAYVIRTAAAVSADPMYNERDAADVDVMNLDNDAQTITISVGDVSVIEGNDGVTSTLSFIAQLSQASTSTVTARFSTTGGTATAGEDYVPVSNGLVTFRPGALTQRISITVHGDALIEDDETVLVTLSDVVGAGIDRAEAVGTIRNDDTIAGLVGDVTVAEGDAGTTNAIFTVTLAQPSAVSVRVDYTTVDGTALAGLDYSMRVSRVTFLPGETEKTIAIPVTVNTRDNVDLRHFSIRLTGATGAGLDPARAEAIGTIVDDDATPSLSAADLSTAEGAAGATRNLTFSVRLSAASNLPVTVDYATADGPATAGPDYTAASGTLTFAPGETTKSVVVAVLGDAAAEPDEAFRLLILSGPVNATLADAEGGRHDPQRRHLPAGHGPDRRRGGRGRAAHRRLRRHHRPGGALRRRIRLRHHRGAPPRPAPTTRAASGRATIAAGPDLGDDPRGGPGRRRPGGRRDDRADVLAAGQRDARLPAVGDGDDPQRRHRRHDRRRRRRRVGRRGRLRRHAVAAGRRRR